MGLLAQSTPVAGYLLKQSPGLLAALVLPGLAAALGALVIGFCSIRVSGVYFIMLTLAFSQVFWAYVVQAASLGAEDGIISGTGGGIVGAFRGRVGLRA